MSSKSEGRYEFTGNTYLIDNEDERYKDFLTFKKKHGFSPDECWSLYGNICEFILPRLIYFRKKVKKVGCHPCCFNSNEEWIVVLDKMIFAFKAYNKDDDMEVPKGYYARCRGNEQKAREAYWNDVAEGMKLFSEYFGNLWW